MRGAPRQSILAGPSTQLWAGFLVCQTKANQVIERTNIKVRPIEKPTKSEVLFGFVV